MRLYYVLLCSLLLSGCASGSHQPTTNRGSYGARYVPGLEYLEPAQLDTTTNDKPVNNQPTGKLPLFNLLKRRGHAHAFAGSAAGPLPGKCKHCQITYNQVAGNQHNEQTQVAKKGQLAEPNSTLSNVGKAKAPLVAGGQNNVAKDQSGSGIASDITGDNNAPQLTNTQPPARKWYDALLTPLGHVIASVVGIASIVGLFWLLVWRKRKQTVEEVVQAVTHPHDFQI